MAINGMICPFFHISPNLGYLEAISVTYEAKIVTLDFSVGFIVDGILIFVMPLFYRGIYFSPDCSICRVVAEITNYYYTSYRLVYVPISF